MPDYRLPSWGLIQFSLPFLLARRRSLAHDGRRVMQANPYPRQVEGLENVPSQDSFVLVMNHYNRRGLRPQILGFIIAALLAEVRPGQREIAWVFAEELERFIYAPVPVPRWLMRWLFRRLAHMYGLLTMPRQWRSPNERATAIRRIIQALKRGPVGLTPEGAGSGILREPLPGSGMFLLALARTSSPFVPVAAYEEEAKLIIRFGQPFHLVEPATSSREETDREACAIVMTAIGRLLPESYQGVYRSRISGE